VFALLVFAAVPGFTADWQEQAEACVARMQDPEQRQALEERADFQAERQQAERWNQLVYQLLPARLAGSDHPHDQLLLRWLTWAEETRSSGIEENPMNASSIDHSRSIAIMDQLARSGSNDPMVLAATMIACPTPSEDIQPGDYCGPQLDERFQAADSGNAYPWLQSAQRAWAMKETERAFELLGKAADSDHMDWYFGRSQLAVAERLQHHLKDEGGLDADELSMMAQTLGPQMVGYPGFLALSQLCSAESVAANDGKIEVCVGATDALAGKGASLMDIKVAAGLARGLAPSLVSTPQKGLQEWAQLQNRNVLNLQNQVAGIGCLALEQGPDAYQALYGQQYLQDVNSEGEFVAQQRLVERFVSQRSE
jgi:hypothetical protein